MTLDTPPVVVVVVVGVPKLQEMNGGELVKTQPGETVTVVNELSVFTVTVSLQFDPLFDGVKLLPVVTPA